MLLLLTRLPAGANFDFPAAANLGLFAHRASSAFSSQAVPRQLRNPSRISSFTDKKLNIFRGVADL